MTRASAAAEAVALDAGRALHLAGRPDHALRWYERTAFSRETPAERWIVLDGFLGAVLALSEIDRLDEIAPLAERADVDAEIRESSRRFVLWRTGRPLAPPSEPRPVIGIFRYWALEEDLASGVPPETVLAAARRQKDASGAVAPLIRLVEAEALARLGRAVEAFPVARDAFEALWQLRLSEVEARGHLAFAAARYARVLEAAGQPAEGRRLAARTRAFLASPAAGRARSPLPVRAD
ncbi:MAG TPA: hypothetical protein PKA62_09715 [Thermoanaerobaculia bacterium]|nr:hypothetical protein [Thermoanaerobaculia bacterium]